MISFACFSPHPPLLLPDVGSEKDRGKVKKTIQNLNKLGEKIKKINPDCIVVSSPHSDWGFNVPLYFLNPKRNIPSMELLIPDKNAEFYFQHGKQFYNELEKNKKYALVASGDMSHCLAENGPYGFNLNGPKFDQDFIQSLKEKNIKNILNLENKYPQAGECGLRSFSFILGVLESAKIDWQPKILSYEFPFGVGYLVVDFTLDKK